MNKNGIDCSKWQGSIDWKKVKNSGIEFAIIRSGWGKESPSQKDKWYRGWDLNPHGIAPNRFCVSAVMTASVPLQRPYSLRYRFAILKS